MTDAEELNPEQGMLDRGRAVYVFRCECSRLTNATVEQVATAAVTHEAVAIHCSRPSCDKAFQPPKEAVVACIGEVLND